MNERLAELLSRQMAGEATDAEQAELQAWLQEHAGDQYFAAILSSYWQSRPTTTPATEILSDQHFAHILEMAGEEEKEETNLPAKTPVIKLVLKWTIAAAFIGLISWSAWWMTGRTGKKGNLAEATQTNEVIARRGTRSYLVLPDSSKVWLNSDSRLVYSASFNEAVREVTLEGEAFFEVAKNPARPFIVHTSGIDVKVLGTAFNVKSYPKDPSIETTLIHGSIEVTNKNEPKGPRLILRPHQKLVFNKEKGFTSPDIVPSAGDHIQAMAVTSLPTQIEDSAIKETAWIYNRLDFEGDTFTELATKMERWFNIKMEITDKKLGETRMHGIFEHETLEEALQALQYIKPFSYTIDGSEVTIRKK